MNLTPGKIPPQSIPAEQAVLGAMLMERDAFFKIAHLTKEMFYKDSHGVIWDACWELFGEGKPIDVLTCWNKLLSMGYEDFGDSNGKAMFYLTELTSRVASSANVEYHSMIIVEKWMLREGIKFCNTGMETAYNETSDPFDFAESGMKFFSSLLNPVSAKNTQSLGDAVGDAIIESEQAGIARRAGGYVGVTTGFNAIDEMNGGFKAGNLIIVAARPSMGKSAYAGQIALHAAEKNIPVAFFSLEMASTEIALRILSIKTGFDGLKIKNSYMDEDEFAYLREWHAKLKSYPLYIDDTPALSILDLRHRAFRLKAEKGIGLIVVDYLQLMHGSRARGASRDEEIGSITGGLKAIAKELDIPVIALSQLSRAVETRGGDKKPMLSDLRESGNIEQDADVVEFLYRPEYYGIQIDDSNNSTAGQCVVITAKYRGGQIGEVKLKFIPHLTKYDEWVVPTNGNDYMKGIN